MMNTRAGAIGLGLAIILSLCGLVLTGLLLDYQVKAAAGGEPLIRPLCEKYCPQCGCDQALTGSWTRFSFWKHGGRSVPTALLGFIYFAAVSAWFLTVGRPSGSRYSWHWLIALLTAAGTAFAGYVGWGMYRTYRDTSSLCPAGAAVEAIVAAVFILTLLIWPRRRLVAVMAEPVSGASREPMPVRVPAPDAPPGRALLAWVLMAAAISALGWLGSEGRICGHAPQQTAAVSPDTAPTETPAATPAPTEADVEKVRQEREALATEAAGLRTALAEAQKSAQELKANAEKAQQYNALASEVEGLRAALADAQQSAQETQARLKDYDDDYQAVWFNFMNEPMIDLPVTPGDSIRGKVDAPHTIVMYMDLQCPYCMAANKVLQQKVAKYPDRLRLVVKHFPLDKSCNEHVTGRTHPAACAAAVTAEAARAIGGEDAFWKMYDELFTHQTEFAKKPKDFVQEACARVGVDNDALWKKINTTSVWSRITEQVQQANQIGIQATPTIYYDGRKVAGWANSRFWDFMMWQDQHQGGAATTQPATTPPPAATTTPPAATPSAQPPATQPQ